jgi:hypothetical protein
MTALLRDRIDALLALGGWLYELAATGPERVWLPDLIRALEIITCIGRDRNFFEAAVTALNRAALGLLTAKELEHDSQHRHPAAAAREALSMRRSVFSELVQTLAPFIEHDCNRLLGSSRGDGVDRAPHLHLARRDARAAVAIAKHRHHGAHDDRT